MLILGDFTYKENGALDSRCSTLKQKVLGVLNEQCLHCHEQNAHLSSLTYFIFNNSFPASLPIFLQFFVFCSHSNAIETLHS